MVVSIDFGTRQESETGEKMSGELTTTSKFEIANPDEVASIWAEELEGFTPEFDRVKVPGAGGLAWEVPTEDPDNPDTVRDLVGVIVDHHPSSRLYLDAYDGSQGKPDAWSLDGKTQHVPKETAAKCKERGLPVPSVDLASCPYNQFGSTSLVGGSGNGKATRNYYEIYLLREGSVLPVQLSVPATSIKNFQSWLMKRVVGAGRRVTGVVAKVTLKKAESKGGITYSSVHFQTESVLDPVTAANIKAYSDGLKTVTRADRYATVAEDSVDSGTDVFAEPPAVEAPVAAVSETVAETFDATLVSDDEFPDI